MDPEGHIVGGPKKLRSVVADALCRWYREAEQEAMQGDVVRYDCTLALWSCTDVSWHPCTFAETVGAGAGWRAGWW